MGFVLGEGIVLARATLVFTLHGGATIYLSFFLAHSPNPPLPYMARMGKMARYVSQYHLLVYFAVSGFGSNEMLGQECLSNLRIIFCRIFR